MSKSTTRQGESRPRFKVGSTYFFGEGQDIDEVEFEEEPKLYKNFMQFRKRDRTRCLFKWRKMSADEFVEYTLNTKLPMEIGKFLVPEVAEYLGFTLEHLKKLRPTVDRLDDKHKYEKVIYDSYMLNKGFYLTQEQRDMAFLVYKQKRFLQEENNG